MKSMVFFSSERVSEGAKHERKARKQPEKAPEEPFAAAPEPKIRQKTQ
jgi:hypothetical protein